MTGIYETIVNRLYSKPGAELIGITIWELYDIHDAVGLSPWRANTVLACGTKGMKLLGRDVIVIDNPPQAKP